MKANKVRIIVKHYAMYRDLETGKWVDRYFALENPDRVSKEVIVLVDKQEIPSLS